MSKRSGKTVVHALTSHVDDDLKYDTNKNYKLFYTMFARLDSSRRFIQHFVGQEYCRGSTAYNCFDQDGIYPDPEDKLTFYICNNNVPIKEQCPIGTQFNSTHASCVSVNESNDDRV